MSSQNPAAAHIIMGEGGVCLASAGKPIVARSIVRVAVAHASITICPDYSKAFYICLPLKTSVNLSLIEKFRATWDYVIVYISGPTLVTYYLSSAILSTGVNPYGLISGYLQECIFSLEFTIVSEEATDCSQFSGSQGGRCILGRQCQCFEWLPTCGQGNPNADHFPNRS